MKRSIFTLFATFMLVAFTGCTTGNYAQASAKKCASKKCASKKCSKTTKCGSSSKCGSSGKKCASKKCG